MSTVRHACMQGKPLFETWSIQMGLPGWFVQFLAQFGSVQKHKNKRAEKKNGVQKSAPLRKGDGGVNSYLGNAHIYGPLFKRGLPLEGNHLLRQPMCTSSVIIHIRKQARIWNIWQKTQVTQFKGIRAKFTTLFQCNPWLLVSFSNAGVW